MAAVAATILFAGAMARPASASLITEDFTVTASGPLAGTYQGSFSYDSSIVVDGGSASGATLLTDLNFTFDGATFTAATANTGGQGELTWDSAGKLVGALFGTPACHGVLCAHSHTNTWFVQNTNFTYSTPTDPNIEINAGNVTFAPAPAAVPEPGTLALFGGGLVGLMGLLRRSRRTLTTA